MTLYLRTVTGAMVDVTRCPILEVTVADDAMFEVVARTDLEDDALRFVLYRDRSKGTATSFLNQIAARANGSEALPIDADGPLALRRSLRFGSPQRSRASK